MADTPVVETELFETNQTNVAAFLVFCGHPICETAWEANSCTFFFRHTAELTNDFAEYVRGEACVEPLSYGNAYNQVKGLVKEQRRSGNKRLIHES